MTRSLASARHFRFFALLAASLASATLAVAPALAEKPAAPAAAKKDAASPFGAMGGGKEPIKIDADRLDVFDRESKAIFAGNVVAVQGDSTIRCSTMTVHYKRGKDKDKKDKDAKDKANPAAEAEEKPKDAAGMGENGIQKVDCAGPVTVVQKDQVATGDSAVFDQAAKRIVLTGNVVLSQCQNVTRGQRLVYDMNTGRANMDPVPGGRVSALFVPGEKSDANKPAKGCPQPAGIAKNGAEAGRSPQGGRRQGRRRRARPRPGPRPIERFARRLRRTGPLPAPIRDREPAPLLARAGARPRQARMPSRPRSRAAPASSTSAACARATARARWCTRPGSRCGPARRSGCSGRTAPARPRSST